jgi:hypothetical protein
VTHQKKQYIGGRRGYVTKGLCNSLTDGCNSNLGGNCFYLEAMYTLQ